jgi:hypothetical protein
VIQRPGEPAPGTLVLLGCRHCGWVISLPYAQRELAAQMHGNACIGQALRDLIARVGSVIPDPNHAEGGIQS